MSIDIMNRIWWREDFDALLAPIQEDHPGSGKNLKWTLLAMADAAGDEGFCWPAVETIARKASLSKRAVQMAIRQAEVLGILKRRHRRDASSQYVIQLDKLPSPQDRQRRSKERGPLEFFDDEPDLFGTGAGGAPVGVQGVHPRGAGDSLGGAGPAPRTVIEPSVEPSLEDSGVFRENARPRLDAYVEQRWNALKREHPGVKGLRKIDDGMRHTIALRAKQHANDGQDEYAVWDEFFETVARSAFLTGKLPPGQGRDKRFSIGLPWALKADNFRKIIGGQYDGNTDHSTHDASSGRRYGPAEQAVRGSVERLRSTRQQRRGSGDPRSDHALPAN